MARDDTSPKSPGGQPQAGVLLYYGYRDLTRDGAQKAVAEWYEFTCTELGLVGRVRVARDGVNATLGGEMEKLKEHMEGVRAHPLLQKPGDEIDMKLAPSSGPRNDACRVESGFDRLRVALCKEVVSLGVEGKAQLDSRRRRLGGGGGGGGGGSSITGDDGGDGYVGIGRSAGGRDGCCGGGASHLCGGGGAAVAVEPSLAAPHVSPSRFHELLMSAAATAAPVIRRSTPHTQPPSPSHANADTPTSSADPHFSPPAPMTVHQHVESTYTTAPSTDISVPGGDIHTGVSASPAAARPTVRAGSLREVDGSPLPPVGSGEGWEGGGRGECGLVGGKGGRGVVCGGRGGEGKGTVLLDARNIYESRIGYFNIEGVTLLRPDTRKFSELPRWIDEHEDALRGKRILMYCTGGVRCERASAYVRAKGDGFQDVLQLHGGIQRYLEAYPTASAGLFQGRLFVFDERVGE